MIRLRSAMMSFSRDYGVVVVFNYSNQTFMTENGAPKQPYHMRKEKKKRENKVFLCDLQVLYCSITRFVLGDLLLCV